MLRCCARTSAPAVVWLGLLAVLGSACSETSRPPDLGTGGYSGAGGAGGDGPFGNPDGGGQMFMNDAAACAPDDDTCIDEEPFGNPDSGQPGPSMDSGVTPDPRDGAVALPDSEVAEPEPDAEVPEPDADVIIPDEDGSVPTAATYKIDLLFVVDNSNSMREEQAALRAQFPMLIQLLLDNTAIGGGDDVVAGAQDIHLGVVSTDLGAPGVTGIFGCTGTGNDGLLNNVAAADVVGCSATTYAPRFLSYVAGTGDPAQLATDLSCLAALGTDGCGFEMQLESMLKSVWPGDDGRITFLADPASGFGMTGQAGPGFPNGDFVRNDDEDDVSVLAVVMVTDEEDCSSNDTAHLAPAFDTQGLNTRCYYEALRPEPNRLFDVGRYVTGLRLLRPGYEHRVVFGAIVGVPPALVTEAALSEVDFSSASERNAHYATILDDPMMQQTIDDRGTADFADDSIRPSCLTTTGSAVAYPPRRIVEVARGFGEHGFVQSICANEWSFAMELLATRIAQARSE